jgi:hypothetical protein
LSAALPCLAGPTARLSFELRLPFSSAPLLFQKLLVSQLLLVLLGSAGCFGVGALMVTRVWLRRYVSCHGDSPPIRMRILTWLRLPVPKFRGGHARFLRTFTSGSAEVSAHPGTLREVLASLDILSLELIGHWVLDMGWNHESSADHPQVCKAAPFDRHYNLCKYIIKALVL